METREKPDDIRTVYFHIHGTRDMGPWLAPGLFIWASQKKYPDLFTKSTSLSLIDLAKAPIACQNFKDIYERFTKEGDRYYFQWSGQLSEEERERAGKFLAAAIQEMQGKEKLRVVILGHSHGGNVGFHAAKELAENKDIEFHMVTVETPLSIDPVILPTDNVKSWQHFYTAKDVNAAVGSMLMQDVSLDFTRQVEEVYMSEVRSELAGGKNLFETKELPETYRSTELTSAPINDPHNEAMRPPLCGDICKVSVEMLDKAFGRQPELPPRPSI